MTDVMRSHETISLLCLWTIAMLSYHQDLRLKTGFGLISQVLAVTSLLAFVAFGFMHGAWWDFPIAAALAWFHVQFVRRWSARPGSWW